MNIEQILRKLSQNHGVQQDDPLHTSESIGTFNSINDLEERSFVIQDQIQHHDRVLYQPNQCKYNQNKKTSTSSYISDRIKKDNAKSNHLDHQLHKIDQMKFMYESRQKSQNKSIQINSSSNKSKEKHHLRPSHTPSFSKINKFSDHSLLQQEFQPKYNMITVLNTENNEIKNKNKQIKLKTEQYFDEDNIEQMIDLSQNYKQNRYNFEKMQSQMRNITVSLSNMQSKLAKLQEKNRLLQERNKQIESYNKKYIHKLEQCEDEKDILVEECRQLKGQKQQLQTILKEVLYKQQREKLQYLKQNNHSSNTRFNNQGRQVSDSKMKVQNVMQKLHLNKSER